MMMDFGSMLKQSTELEMRRVSRNSSLVILVGGPLFSMHPEWAAEVGADATTLARVHLKSLRQYWAAACRSSRDGRACLDYF